jgi:hypothetical protein
MNALTSKAPTMTAIATAAITAISLMWLLGDVAVVESEIISDSNLNTVWEYQKTAIIACAP